MDESPAQIPLDHPPELSALLFNTTTLSIHQCLHIHFIESVHLSLYTTKVGLNCIVNVNILRAIILNIPGID
jgi:hypothetical protein